MMQALVAARLVLAAVFATAGIAKLADRAGSRKTLVDFGIPESVVPPIALVLPLAELASAIALIPARSAWLAAWAVLAMLGLFVIGIGLSLARGRAPECHCFGQLHSAPIGWSTLARNIFLSALAVFVIWQGPDVGGSPIERLANLNGIQLTLFTLSLVVAGIMAVGVWLVLHLLRQNGRLLLRLEAVEAKLGMSSSDGAPTPNPATPRGLPVDTAAPAFTGRTLDGSTVTLDSLSEPGKWLLLVFVEANCNPCNLLLPTVARWQEERAAYLAVAVISKGEADETRSKIGNLSLKNVVLQPDRKVAQSYQVTGTPAALLVSHGSIASPLAEGAEPIRALVQRITSLPPLRNGDRLPSFQLDDLTGQTVDLGAIQNKTMVLFWNPLCGFCRQMLGDLKAWEQSKLSGAPELLVVSSGSPDAIRADGFRARVLLDQNFSLGHLFGAEGTPAAAIIERGRLASDVRVGSADVFELAGAVPAGISRS